MGIQRATELIELAIQDGAFPGAVFAVSLNGAIETRAVGHVTYCPDSAPMTPDLYFDLASVSKVVATTTCAMHLVEGGKFELDQPVANYVPEFAQAGKDRITVRNLLVHDSGLIAFRPYHQSHTEAASVRAAIWAESLTYPTGTKMVYSDLNMIALQEIIERTSGVSLDRLFAQLMSRVRIEDLHYRQGASAGQDLSRYVPTERAEDWRRKLREQRGTFRRVSYGSANETGEFIQGEVHDPTATVLGGVAGHAGLFGSIGGLGRFIVALLLGEIVSPQTVKTWTARQSNLSSRALGWDTKSPEGSSAGTLMGPRSFGHTGYTGTSVWIDPDTGNWAVLLTNRVHPTAQNTKIIPFRSKFHDALWASD